MMMMTRMMRVVWIYDSLDISSFPLLLVYTYIHLLLFLERGTGFVHCSLLLFLGPYQLCFGPWINASGIDAPVGYGISSWIVVLHLSSGTDLHHSGCPWSPLGSYSSIQYIVHIYNDSRWAWMDGWMDDCVDGEILHTLGMIVVWKREFNAHSWELW